MSWWAANDLVAFVDEVRDETGFKNYELIQEIIIEDESFGMYMIEENDPNWRNLVSSVSEKLVEYNDKHSGCLDNVDYRVNIFCYTIQQMTGLNWLKVRNHIINGEFEKYIDIEQVDCIICSPTLEHIFNRLDWDEEALAKDKEFTDLVSENAEKLMKMNKLYGGCLAEPVYDVYGKPITSIEGYSI